MSSVVPIDQAQLPAPRKLNVMRELFDIAVIFNLSDVDVCD
jgi:hypothetical protein